jgi:DivIVA domain-containing protein
MIDLTPLDVRKKKGDFRRAMRGYEPELVDSFLDLVADRLDELVRENVTLRERVNQLTQAIDTFRERERALNEALISAQQLREDMRSQASREADLTLREARAEAERVVDEARRQAASTEDALRRVQAQRAGYLRSLRALVERQLGEVEQEEERLRDLLRADAEPPPQRPSVADGSRPDDSWLTALDEIAPPRRAAE